jgi:myo-inositol-1(or 4)-monophosphatase
MRDQGIEHHEYSEDLKRAVVAARLAGDFLLRSYQGSKLVRSVTERDIKIEEDRLSEEIILNELTKSSHAILSEEAGELNGVTDSSNSELKWIVDPLDGTYNYLRCIPICGVSIALWKGEEPIFGVVNGFALYEMFIGIVGIGAWCNDVPIQVGARDSPTNGIIASGFPAGFEFSDVSVDNLLKDALAYKKIRMLGSAAMSLAYLAAGRIDAYQEENIMFWDVAGGLAIVKAAGGAYLKESTDTVNQYLVRASSAKMLL